MQTQWKDWLAAERAAGRSGIVLSDWSIVRGQAFVLPLVFPGDMTGAVFEAAVFVSPDADGAGGVAFTADVAPYDEAAGTTLVTLTLDAEDSGSGLPPDDNLDGLAEVIFKLDITPAGGEKLRALGLVLPVVE